MDDSYMGSELSEQYNQFLINYNANASCDTACQEQKELAQLEENYNNAVNNLNTAPEQVQTAYKAYLTYAEGSGAYQQYQQGSVQQQAESIATNYQANFDADMKSAFSALASYSGLYVNYTNIYDLNNIYVDENQNLQRDVDISDSDTLTNDRKTYYENQALDSLNWYYWALTIIYTIVVICYGISLLTKQSDYKTSIKIMVLICLIVYPFISMWISLKILSVYNYIIGLLPKNQYQDL